MKKIVRIILYIVLLLLPFSASTEEKTEVAAPIPVYTESYPFIRMDYNSIVIPGKDSSCFRSFYQKINDVIIHGDSQINILHIGGSHVQADMFSHKVRKNLDMINAPFQSPRGFIFPFKVANTNNPTNYKVSYTGTWKSARNVQSSREVSLGVGGIAVYTSDPEASLFIELNPEEVERRWTFDRLRLLGYPEDEDAQIYPILYYQGDTIFSYRDLISDTYVFEMPELTDHFELGFHSDDDHMSTFIVNGFIPEKDAPGIIYHAIGVNGASTESYLNSEFFEKELAIIMPDMVVFGIGINDAANKDFTPELFHQNYTELVKRIRNINPNCAFIFITNNDSYKKISKKQYRVNRNGLIARDVFYQLAAETQGGVWDMFSLMGGLESMAQWENAGLAQRDKIHFKRSGYELLGDLLYNAFLTLYYEFEFNDQ